MGNEFGKPEEEAPVIKFLGYATMEEINAEARLNREKLEKEFNRMRKKGQPGPRHPFDICSFCGGKDHYLQDCASHQDAFEHAGSETESYRPMVCTLCFEFGDHLAENCPNPLDVSDILITRDSDSGPDSSESTTGHGSCPSTPDGNRHDDDTRDIIESPTAKEIPVVVVSSENIQTRIEKCLEEGAEEFLLKPLRQSDVKRLKCHLAKEGDPADEGMLCMGR